MRSVPSPRICSSPFLSSSFGKFTSAFTIIQCAICRIARPSASAILKGNSGVTTAFLWLVFNLSNFRYEAWSFFNATTNQVEISCGDNGGRRLAEADWRSSSAFTAATRVAARDPDAPSSRELVASYLVHNPELAARLGVADGGIDDALVGHVEKLVQLFGPPALV